MRYGERQFARLLPSVTTIQPPFITPNIVVPFIGCFPGDGNSYVGKKFANRPDILRLNHLKQKKRELEEEIITQTIGKLDNPMRSAGFTTEIARITADIAEIVDAITETVGAITEEINAGIAFVNQRKSELEQERNELLAIPADVRSKLEQHMLTRYDEYFGELEAQADRLQSIIGCLGAF
jgi:hypothetical protein